MYTVSQQGFWANMYIVHLVAQCVAPITAGRQCWKTTHYIVVQKPQCSCSLCSGQGQSKFTWINLESQKDIDLIFHCLMLSEYETSLLLNSPVHEPVHMYYHRNKMYHFYMLLIQGMDFSMKFSRIVQKNKNKTLSDVATYSSST